MVGISFLGSLMVAPSSDNAVRIQIAVVLIANLILRIARGARNFAGSLLAFARFVRTNLMHRRSLWCLRRLLLVMARRLMGGIPAFETTPHRVIADGDLVAFHSTYEGYAGPMPLVAFDIVRVVDG